MNTEKFIDNCKKLVSDYISRNFTLIPREKIHVVWQSKVLQNNKALLAVIEVPPEMSSLYFEVTYNGDKKEYYLDIYKKHENKLIHKEYLK